MVKTHSANHPLKIHPTVGACGLDCGLCPSFHRETSSRCPGCCGPGFWDVHPGCSFITCCTSHNRIETCGECNESESCPRIVALLEKARHSDSFISYQTISANLEFIRNNGILEWAKQQDEKIAFLEKLLANFFDGHSKTFYCLSVQLLPFNELKASLVIAHKQMTQRMDSKLKIKLVKDAFSELAAKSGVVLKLRKGN